MRFLHRWPPLWGNLDALQNRGYKPLPQAKMNTSCQKLYTPFPNESESQKIIMDDMNGRGLKSVTGCAICLLVWELFL